MTVRLTEWVNILRYTYSLEKLNEKFDTTLMSMYDNMKLQPAAG